MFRARQLKVTVKSDSVGSIISSLGLKDPIILIGEIDEEKEASARQFLVDNPDATISWEYLDDLPLDGSIDNEEFKEDSPISVLLYCSEKFFGSQLPSYSDLTHLLEATYRKRTEDFCIKTFRELDPENYYNNLEESMITQFLSGYYFNDTERLEDLISMLEEKWKELQAPDIESFTEYIERLFSVTIISKIAKKEVD